MDTGAKKMHDDEELAWEKEKELLGLPPGLSKDNCIRSADEARKYEFKVDPFISIH